MSQTKFVENGPDNCDGYKYSPEEKKILKQLDDVSWNLPVDNTICFLRTRPWYQAYHNELNHILHRFAPETHIVACPMDFRINPNKATLFLGCEQNCQMIRMQNSACHDNCEELYQKGLIVHRYTGYALSSDGLWRFHSWGINNNGQVVETTESRVMYYGIISDNL
jgi:hypothetical protein